ncbi:hypothetical protein [Maribacter sp. 2-571]|uniref:hypothetical protein n=1 Tax=Maribacter sp. 2-571 TaxID=3417569 RepID=UPI003D33BFF4
MRIHLPLELYFSDAFVFGVVMLLPGFLFLLIAIILLFTKDKKSAKTLFIIAGICFLVSLGLCSIGGM